MTQRQLAIRLGVSWKTVGNWEIGRFPCRGPAAVAILALAGEARARLQAEIEALLPL